MLRRRVELNTSLEELRARKNTMMPEDYEAALEKLLLELARIDRALKSKQRGALWDWIPSLNVCNII
jgi:hypothetical protein